MHPLPQCRQQGIRQAIKIEARPESPKVCGFQAFMKCNTRALNTGILQALEKQQNLRKPLFMCLPEVLLFSVVEN